MASELVLSLLICLPLALYLLLLLLLLIILTTPNLLILQYAFTAGQRQLSLKQHNFNRGVLNQPKLFKNLTTSNQHDSNTLQIQTKTWYPVESQILPIPVAQRAPILPY